MRTSIIFGSNILVRRRSGSGTTVEELSEPDAVLFASFRVELAVSQPGFDLAKGVPVSDVFGEVGDGDLSDGCSAIGQHINGCKDCRCCFGVNTLRDELLVHADPDSLQLAGGRHVVRHVVRKAGWVIGVVSGNCFEHDRGVGNRPCHRADMIQRICQGQHPVAAHPAPGRLESNDSACGRRKPDGSARVASQRTECEAGRRGDSGAARRSSRPGSSVPRIHGDLKCPVVSCHGPLGEVQLAEDHGSRGAETLDDSRVIFRNEVLQHRTAAHGADAPRITQVFHADRNTMQWPTVLSGCQFLVGRLRRCLRRFGHDCRVGVPGVIQGGDAFEHDRREFG